MEQTLFQKLKEYDKTMLPMHMPGHKRNLALSGKGGYLEALGADCDITEIAGFDNLAEPEAVLLSLKARAAALWNSDEAYPLVNGSTCGVLASIYATVPQGGKVIVARNCHKSVYHGLQLLNAEPTFLLPEMMPDTGACGAVTPEAVEAAVVACPDAKLVIVTSPTYEGVLSDVEGICRVAHAHGVPVLVDSAHGAHLGFGRFPKSAVQCGADLVVQSLHKTLPSLTQTAMLHRSGTLVAAEQVQSAINIFQTSSPSYLLLASIDGCIRLMEEQGEALFAEWYEALEEFYKAAKLLQKIQVVSAGFAVDKSKLIISTNGTTLTGPELMERLRTEHHIELEMAAEQYALAMTGPGDTKESLARLLRALYVIDEQCDRKPERTLLYPVLPAVRMRVAEALSAEATELSLREAVGKVAAEYVWAYPPGIPLLVPGEEISEEMVKFLVQKEENGVVLHGMAGEDKISVVKNV